MSAATRVPDSGPAAGPRAISDTVLTVGCVGLLLAATALALWLRLAGLPRQDGTLSIDEARLALAARGIVEQGMPVMPTGWLYTRGLLPAYLAAGSFAALGQTDFAARLPSVLAGTALVPVTYAAGMLLGGRAGGLMGALFVAVYTPLVAWSRQAWFYAAYVLLFTGAMLFILRAHRGRGAGDQLLAGVLAGLALFAHEFGVFLLLPLAVQATLRLRRDRARPRGWWAPVAALLLVAAAAALVAMMAIRLRADTLAGWSGEVDEYAPRPRLDPAVLRFYTRMLLDGRGLIALAALIGVPLAVARRDGETLLLWLALLPTLAYVATLEGYDRYGLAPMVALVLLAVRGVALLARWFARRVPSSGIRPGEVALALTAIVLAYHLDPGAALAVGRGYPDAGVWLREARRLGIAREDRVLTDLPTVVGWYLGDVDYWARSSAFGKYTVGAGDPPREVHTGAALVRDLADYQRVVVRPNPGRSVWVLASGRSAQWGTWLDPDLKKTLERSAALRIEVVSDGYVQFSDQSLILRVDLP